MKRMKLKNKDLVESAMTEFLMCASDLEYYDEQGNPHKKVPWVVDGGRFSAYTDEDDCDTPFFFISYGLDELFYSSGTKDFRKDFVERSPKSRGFANITISLLHELGHLETDWYDFGDYDRDTEVARVTSLPISQINREYFKLPDEAAATDWAIDWLSKKENRIAAKNFERKFFSCFAPI